MSTQSQGKCLCGKVELSVKIPESFGACHCGMCRRWGGGPFLTMDCGSDVSFTNQDLVEVFDSSQWAERGFCKTCGTHLFYRLKQNQQYFIPLGLVENSDQLPFDHQVFIDRKPPNYEFTAETKNMTEAEIFAMYSPS